MTESQKLIDRVRLEAHAERAKSGQATPLQVVALDLANFYEIAIAMNLKMERIIHDFIKGAEDERVD